MNAKPLDSSVSGLRITLTASATRLSAVSQPLISSAVTQTGKLPRKTVKLIRRLSSTPLVGVLLRETLPEALTSYHSPRDGAARKIGLRVFFMALRPPAASGESTT